MMMTHIFADSRGESHFADVEIPVTLAPVAAHLPPMSTSPAIASTHVQFVAVPPAVIARDWHPAPARQFVLLLKGELGVEVSDGETRAFTQGSIVFLEDTKGKGHKDHAVNDDELLLALIPVPDGMTIGRLIERDRSNRL
jgi:hypothetical protein